MRAVILVRIYDGEAQQVAEFYVGTPSAPLVATLAKARTYTNGGHAKCSIIEQAKDVAWRIRHGVLGEQFPTAKLARFFVVPVKLKLLTKGEPEEYTP